MRYRLTTSRKERHAQVMTPPDLATLLVKSISPGVDWLELGSGSGNIVDACVESNDSVEYVGVEIDRQLMRRCTPRYGVKYLQANVLDPAALESVLGAQSFSRAIGNPPYGVSVLSPAAERRLGQLCPGLVLSKGWGHLDLYFVLESLARLRRPGEAAFIVGAAIAEDANLRAFRKTLIETASEVECYELPLDAFQGHAEVQSYLLIARFGARGKCKVTVGRISGERFRFAEKRTISPEAGFARLDLGYHKFLDMDRTLRMKAGCATLKELGAVIVRGSRTKAQFLDLAISHFHTSDFPRDAAEVHFDKAGTIEFQLAAEGDILLPRVGTRCLDRHAIVVDGTRPYTEAVYRVRLPSVSRNKAMKWISSDAGTFWRRAVATGSCAKHLTVANLLNMPVPR